MREELIEYLIENRDYFKEKYKSLLDKKIELKLKENWIFHNDIDEEFDSNVIQSMSVELSRSTGADMETIMIVLEDMNVKEFLK